MTKTLLSALALLALAACSGADNGAILATATAADAGAGPAQQPAMQRVKEGEVFKVPVETVVRFGSGNSWAGRMVPADMAVMCHVDVFGDPGVPAPRVCEYAVSSPAQAPRPAPRAAAASPATPDLPDVVDASGKVIAPAYIAMAAAMSKPAGVSYRYGPNAASYGASGGVPLHGPRPDHKFPNDAYYWQVGQKGEDSGAYSTNQANLLFVADDPANVGVTDFQTSGYMYGAFAQLPQLSWTLYGLGLDSINVMAYKAAGTVGGDSVAVTRCGGRGGFCAEGLVAFQNGVIATVGTNTANNKTTVKLPPNKVPTGIAMTNDSEFALVTVWDTQSLKGQVAVIALAGLCDECNPYDRKASAGYKAWYEWWNDWMGVYPGLPSMGNIAFMKILGYVDLVASDGTAMAAPTEIAVTTGMDQFNTMLPNGKGFMGYANPLTSQANRQRFLNGDLSGMYARGGMAVVISKSEKKAAFIDLKPLFGYVNSVYFGGDLGTFNARMASLGPADNQWPYTFANKPQQKPTVVRMISMADRPTAVKTTVFGPTQRAWIATQDGTLRVYALGNYAPGHKPASPTPSAIAELPQFAINVGRNPTSMSISKGEPDDPELDHNNQQVLVNSRGDRKISWVRFGADGSSIARVLQDPRMKDPVAVEDADNFANSGYIVTVADYEGKAVHNFRYGPVVFSDGRACPASAGGCPVVPTGAIRIEYGGMMAVPGRPFQLSGANVP